MSGVFECLNGEMVELSVADVAERDAWRASLVSAAPPGREITAVDFITRFTPTEISTLQADPILNAACLKAIAQGTVNLDSPELSRLLGYAELQGKLTAERAAQIVA